MNKKRRRVDVACVVAFQEYTFYVPGKIPSR